MIKYTKWLKISTKEIHNYYNEYHMKYRIIKEINGCNKIKYTVQGRLFFIWFDLSVYKGILTEPCTYDTLNEAEYVIKCMKQNAESNKVKTTKVISYH